jgi:proline dehydrogenase
MLRQALLWASTNPVLAERLPRYGFVRRATRRFMPGEELGDALGAASELGGTGIAATLTLLGEHLRSDSEADEVLEHYREVSAAITQRGVDAEISVKPTQLGLDFGVARTRDRIASLLRATRSTVWIDMESSKYVDGTLEIYRSLRAESPNVGVCLQCYLLRTEADLEALMPLDPSIRIVKGAYQEPPTVAMAKKADVDRNFVRLASRLLRARAQGGTGRPVIATHDPRMIAEAGRLAVELGLAKGTYEYSLLYGIARPEQQRLARNGHRVRVLISYGKAWFPWYMRRLAERPANLWFVAKQLVG